MSLELSRRYILGRAVTADEWLRRKHATSLTQAPPELLAEYLDTLDPSTRENTLRALSTWGDEMMLRGAIQRNAARALRDDAARALEVETPRAVVREIDLRDEVAAQRKARRTTRRTT